MIKLLYVFRTLEEVKNVRFGRLVNEKVLITFACSMFSLLTLSSVLSHIKIDKNDKKVKASISDLKNEKLVKVDAVDSYSKNQVLTVMPPITSLTNEEKMEEEVKAPEPQKPSTTNHHSERHPDRGRSFPFQSAALSRSSEAV